ncbi:hypothetical protein [Polyangium jinanense]|uniref:Uncharacterized protein n=1 Tax=Polyangium jinanense TaxID=2829994 RepID=A0A9X3XDE2_9BACT|nr:hypothetical protein [Polyangium jinanense]MDC3960158.1 hypothetical protein [Polyangium jinanense]MDC3986598.1 hypothetical protein [Polyangium jinanense]
MAALAALGGDALAVYLEARGVDETHEYISLEEARRLVRAHLSKDMAQASFYVGRPFRVGRWTCNLSVDVRGEAYKGSVYHIPMSIWGDDRDEFFLRREPHRLGMGPHSASVEAAAMAIDTEGDVEDLLLGLCAPDAGLVTFGACCDWWPWRAPLESNATYHANAAGVARDLALSWVHVHDGYKIGYIAELSLDELAARVETAPEGARIGVATLVDGVRMHGKDDDEASLDDPRRRHFSPLARKGARPIGPGDEMLTREQVLRAIATPPSALLEALEASAAALRDDEWRAAEPLARKAIHARTEGAPTREITVTERHERFIEQHAPYHVRRLPNGGVLLATHPFRTLWQLWSDALRLLGIRT